VKTFVHIGMPKCGSTAIRRWLVGNRDEIESGGLLVLPADARDVSHAWLFRDFDAQMPELGERRETLAASYEARAPRWTALYQRDLSRIQASPLTSCIMTSEYFFLAASPGRLLAPLDRKNTRALMFVRSQQEVYDSAFFDLMRHPLVDLETAMRARSGWTIDYAEIEGKWLDDGFAIDVLPHDGNVIRDLREAAGIDSPRLANDVVLHRTLPATVVAYLFRRKAEHMGDPRWPAVCDFFDDAFPLFERFPRGWCIDADTRADIERQHRAANRTLVARHPRLAATMGRRDNWREADPQTRTVGRLCDRIFKLALARADTPPNGPAE
jgi:hypothetical protein